MTTLESIQFTPVSTVNFAALLQMARQIFTDTFSHLFEPDAFEDFCNKAYAKDGVMAKDINDPSVFWWVAKHSGNPIGYAKLTLLRAPAQFAQPGAMELQQIYVLAKWQGTGIADELMSWAISFAKERHAPELYLTVFDHNERAKRFYARYGFIEVGHCTFSLGGHKYDDRIWCKNLAPVEA